MLQECCVELGLVARDPLGQTPDGAVVRGQEELGALGGGDGVGRVDVGVEQVGQLGEVVGAEVVDERLAGVVSAGLELRVGKGVGTGGGGSSSDGKGGGGAHGAEGGVGGRVRLG